MRRMIYLILAFVLAGAAPRIHAQDHKAEIQTKVSSQFALTQATKDRNDIASTGSLLVLHKNGLLMYGTSNPVPPQSAYKKGKITRNPFGRGFLGDLGNSMVAPGSSATIVQRTFVTGEKLWATKVDVKDDGVVFGLFSDPINDVRYYGELKFPFSKGQAPPAGDMMNTIAEVLTVDSENSSSGGDGQSQSATAGPPVLPPIAPPPPPPDTPPAPPKTIALGQTKDQVLATFGQPQKVATVGTKEIDYYPDMKVTLVNGRVTDIE